ncbi:Hsp20/alpha crystallin family protein [Oribacterium sp. WCC10]|uniref:Hsp20/alpha crystallin family protein n=1 Tax=Oribacterium sp. WCC10 TaxID=1855343 RepID=UPI000B81B47C
MYMPGVFGENLMDDLFGDFDYGWNSKPVQNKQSANLMRTDIKENDKAYEMAVELPGYKKEDVKLELNDGYLKISATHNDNKEEKDKEGRIIRRERYSGSMQRSFYVGDDFTPQDIEAKFEDGILKIDLPKKEVKQIEAPKYIEIK